MLREGSLEEVKNELGLKECEKRAKFGGEL